MASINSITTHLSKYMDDAFIHGPPRQAPSAFMTGIRIGIVLCLNRPDVAKVVLACIRNESHEQGHLDRNIAEQVTGEDICSLVPITTEN